jgi:hypothetical protein
MMPEISKMLDSLFFYRNHLLSGRVHMSLWPRPHTPHWARAVQSKSHFAMVTTQLNHVNDVIKGVDSFESVRHRSSLRTLVLALVGYQSKPLHAVTMVYFQSISQNARMNLANSNCVLTLVTLLL